MVYNLKRISVEVEEALWSTLPLTDLMSLRTFILNLDVLDWEPTESNIMQETALCCLKIISPSITELRLQFYLMDLRLARADCLFSEARWTVVDYALSCLPALETVEISVNVKVFIGHDKFVCRKVDERFERSLVNRLSLTACEYSGSYTKLRPDDNCSILQHVYEA